MKLMKDMYETTRGYGQPEIDAQGYYGMDMQELVFVLDSNKYPMSLSAPIDQTEEGSVTLQERIADPVEEDTKLDHFILKQLIASLSPRDRKIIIMRYYRDKTQSEIAKELGVSQVQVSRIENKVIEKMRKKFND